MIKQFSLILLFVALSTISMAQKTLKIVNYNTMHGFEGDDRLKNQFITWINEVNPDVVSYQEMIGFSAQELTEFAARYGHKYAVIMNKEAGVDVTHPLAITSRYPITNVNMVLDSLWHGYLNVKISGFNFFVTHLAPFRLKDRQQDITRIIADLRKVKSSGNVILLGDFNALAKSDAVNYKEKDIDALRKLEGTFMKKSGTPIVKNKTIYINNLDNGKIDYSIIDRLLKEGFVDSYKKVHTSFKNSIPTKRNDSDAMLRRIDFIFISKKLQDRIISADVIKDNVTNYLSDHYPALLELKVGN